MSETYEKGRTSLVFREEMEAEQKDHENKLLYVNSVHYQMHQQKA